MSPLAQAQCFCPTIGMVGTDPTQSRSDEDTIARLQMALPTGEASDELLSTIADAIERIKEVKKPNSASSRIMNQKLAEVAAHCSAVIDQLEVSALIQQAKNADASEELSAVMTMVDEFRFQVYEKLCELQEIGETGGPEELAEAMNKLAEFENGPLSSLELN